MAVQNRAYDKMVEYIGDNTIDLDGTGPFKVALFNTSHVYTATNTALANITANQLGTANGYISGGDTVTPTWLESGGTVTFDSDDPTWTAAGGSITASDGVLYDDSTTSPADALMCDIDFDGNQTAGDGTQFIIVLNTPNGWFTAAYTDA